MPESDSITTTAINTAVDNTSCFYQLEVFMQNVEYWHSLVPSLCRHWY